MTRRRLMLLASGVAALALVVALGALGALGFLIPRREAPVPEPGIARTLAEDRAARISALSYDVTFQVPADRTQPVAGRIVAAFTLADASRPLPFDFAQPVERLKTVQANDRALVPDIRNGHVVIPADALAEGVNRIVFEFAAGDEALNRRDGFMYTLFVPARASLAMPCFDQPDLKARWQLTLDLPSDWDAVSNGAEIGRIDRSDGSELIFSATAPLPTYLFAFAAGRFSVETAERNGRTFRMFHRETDPARVARNRDAIFDLHASALAWLEDYTAIGYPFGKFDIVVIPSFQFSGMEHPGAVYYNASALLLDESATRNQLLARASVISHETAHMWFGDLVTMRWFNDVWMKEVFASFMAAKIVNPSFPAIDHELRFLLQNYPVAYDVDRTEGANPIRQDLANLDDAASLYGAIIYQKAPIAMRQLELLIGEGPFREGLREYLQRFALGNASWPDLVAILDAKTEADLATWSREWVEERGRPVIRTTTDGRRFTFETRDPLGRGLAWPQRIRLAVGSEGGIETVDLTLPAAEAWDAGAPPKWVLPAGGGLAYGFLDLDPATLEFLATSMADIPDPLTRGAALVTLWESMLEGRVAPRRVFDQLLSALPRERDELLVNRMLDQVRALFWRFSGEAERAAIAPRLEGLLREGLARAGTTSLKAAWFAALRSTVTTAPGLAWLERVWRRQETIDGLPLAEPDEADLALDLAVRGVPRAQEILDAQLARFQDPDRKARFAFVSPALSPDQTVRAGFFDSLQRLENRRQEEWVLEAVRYLHHPLRASASQAHVRPALDLVLEIQRTGDIFFPKRWADATLAGYQSAAVADEVRGFIDGLPAGYPPRLRWVLLSSADPLFRAARLLSP